MSSVGHKIYVSFLKGASASKIYPDDLTLDELAEKIRTTKASAKDRLPWLKLASFGNKKTANGSLRHDANVHGIYGIELDYDDEKLSFFDGYMKLKQLDIACLIYTSPSHTKDKPRWRILAPTSEELKPEMRIRLVARLNGRLDGILGKHPESFTLSQSFYYGSVNGNPDHRVEVLHGEFIDRRKDFEEFEQGGMPPRAEPEDNPFINEGSQDDDAEDDGRNYKGKFDRQLEMVGDDGSKGQAGFNKPLSEAAATYVGLFENFPFDREKLKAIFRAVIDAAPEKPGRASSPQNKERYKSDKYLDGIIKSAGRKFDHRERSVLDFVADLGGGNFIYDPTGEPWSAKSVDDRLRWVPVLRKDGRISYKQNGKARMIRPTTWLRKNRKAEQRSWMPGQPKIIKSTLITQEGVLEKLAGHDCFNFYTAPVIPAGDAKKAEMWVDHVRKLFPDESPMMLDWFAHRYIAPGEKINFALMIGGIQGLGKDTIITPAGLGLGAKNFKTVSAVDICEDKFDAYKQSVLLLINEIHDLGDSNKYKFYQRVKPLCAAPPMSLTLNEKNVKKYYVPNICGVAMTTNHREAIFLSPDDRRTFVCWSTLQLSDFPDNYFPLMWDWLDHGGMHDVWAYLRQRDISAFKPKAPPWKTDAHKEIVSASRNLEAEELGEIIDGLATDAVTLEMVIRAASADFSEWLADRKNGVKIGHRFNDAGFSGEANPHHKRGLWKINGESVRIWVRDSIGSNQPSHERKRLRQIIAQNLVDNENRGDQPNRSNVHPFSRPH